MDLGMDFYLNTSYIIIMIEHIYCIHLKDYKERKKLMEEQFIKLESKINCEFVDAIKFDEDIVHKTLCHLGSMKRSMSQIAISFSHIKCLRQIYNNRYSVAGIIEDDVVLVDYFYNKLTTYFNNTPEIITVMRDEPCVVFLTGLSSIDSSNNSNSFVDIGPQFGLPFYLINYQMAKILIDDLYPINVAFDNYLIETVHKFKIKTFSALPLLCYDLSSDYYKEYWKNYDLEFKKNVTRLSNIYTEKPIIHNIVHNCNIGSINNALLKYISRNISRSSISFYNRSLQTDHILFSRS